MFWTSDTPGTGISIHALREEGDRIRKMDGSGPNDFYPRPPRGGRRDHTQLSENHLQISIHALREEGDVQLQSYARTAKLFLSTPSARRATITNQIYLAF